MEIQEIEVIIDKNGNVQIRVKGVKGMGCGDLGANLEKALGGKVESREFSPEAYENPATEALPDRAKIRN